MKIGVIGCGKIGEKQLQLTEIFEFPRVDLFEKELKHFIQNIREEQHPLNSIEDSIKTLEIIESIRE